MKRFFLAENFTPHAILQLTKQSHSDELHHLSKVLRLSAGATVKLTNGQGQGALAKILSLHKESAELEIIQLENIPPPPAHLCLWQAVLKGPKMDWLVEKITECGVRELQPVLTQFTVVGNESEKRVERWERITHSALKQSGAPFLPRVHAPLSLEKALSTIHPQSWKIFLHPDPTAEALAKICLQASAATAHITLAIGPEGGFSDAEVKLLKEQGFIPAHLGSNILRGETAGLLASAFLLQLLEIKQGCDISKL